MQGNMPKCKLPFLQTFQIGCAAGTPEYPVVVHVWL